jgi:hypothetical protein
MARSIGNILLPTRWAHCVRPKSLLAILSSLAMIYRFRRSPHRQVATIMARFRQTPRMLSR